MTEELGVLAGNGASALSEVRVAWLRGDPAAPEPKLLVYWRDPVPLPGAADAVAFGPRHPAMAKGNLRWISASAFVAAMGGAAAVSLVRLSNRNGLAAQSHHDAVAAPDPAAPNLLTLRVPREAPPTLLRISTSAGEFEEAPPVRLLVGVEGRAGGTVTLRPVPFMAPEEEDEEEDEEEGAEFVPGAAVAWLPWDEPCSGVYRPPTSGDLGVHGRGLRQGTLRLRLRGPFAVAELLLPPLPRPRSAPSALTQPRAFQHDYFLQVRRPRV